MKRVNAVVYLLALLLALLTHASHAQQVLYEGIDMGKGWTRAWVDADGDGRDDFCFLWGDWDKDLRCHFNRANGFATQNFMNLWQGQGAPEGGSLRWSDLNGDGFVDICRAVALPSTRLACRFGPTFSTGVEVPWTLSSSIENCTGEGVDRVCTTPTFVPGIAGVEFAPGSYQVGAETPDFHLTDVDGDGIPDLCYVYRTSVSASDIRCRIGVVGANRATVSYQAESAPWTRADITVGEVGWPQGFHDFNGDGRGDFCRRAPGGWLRCTLSSAGGFVQTEVSSLAPINDTTKEGAAFVDANGDGKVDFCRLSGGPYHIRCALSNGVGWEFNANQTGELGNARERISPTLSDAGHSAFRWWVDVNGDGLADFCRLASSPDPVGNGTSSVSGTLLCRLGRADGDSLTSRVSFGYSDVSITTNLGRADGGRAFCDALGTGIPMFCRATYRTESAGQVCTTYGESELPWCYEATIGMHGFHAGYDKDFVQARQSLLTAYSDGVGAETRISYLPLTSSEVYSRSNTASNTDSRLLLMQPRSPVVYETRAWTLGSTPITLTGNARYLYKDLRTDIKSGSLGFRERWIYHEGANTVDHVVYYQGLGPSIDPLSASITATNDLREVGIAKCQEKYAVVGALIPVPENQPGGPQLNQRVRALSALREKIPSISSGALCSLPDTNPTTDYPFVLLQVTRNTPAVTEPQNPRIKFVGNASVKSWDWNGSSRVPLPETETTTRMDDVGNVFSLVQVTRDSANREWRKTTTNTFGADNRTDWILGRLTRSEVRTLTPTAAVQLAANGSSVGTSNNADRMSPTTPTPLPIHPAVLSAILQLLLDD